MIGAGIATGDHHGKSVPQNLRPAARPAEAAADDPGGAARHRYGRLAGAHRELDEAVDKSLKHDIAWTGQHGRSELFDFARAIIEAEDAFNPEAQAQIELTLDILFSRINTWQAGIFGNFVASSERGKRAAEHHQRYHGN